MESPLASTHTALDCAANALCHRWSGVRYELLVGAAEVEVQLNALQFDAPRGAGRVAIKCDCRVGAVIGDSEVLIEHLFAGDVGERDMVFPDDEPGYRLTIYICSQLDGDGILHRSIFGCYVLDTTHK